MKYVEGVFFRLSVCPFIRLFVCVYKHSSIRKSTLRYKVFSVGLFICMYIHSSIHLLVNIYVNVLH